MKKALAGLALIFAACSVSAAENEERTRRSSGPSRDEFQDVVVYNIFNPDRGPKPPPPKREERKPTPPPPRVDRLTLTGIIMGREGNYGFFDGSARDFQAVVKQGDKLAEFEVAKVSTDYVDLVQGTNKFQLKIRGELTKKGDDPWKSSGTSSGNYTASTRSPSPSATSTASGSSGGDSAADAERKRKLLELLKKRRESK